MAWFANLPTRAKLLLGFGAMWLMLAVVVAVAYWGITEIAHFEREMEAQSLPRIQELQDLRSGVNYNRGQMLELTLTVDRADQQATARNIIERSKQLTVMAEHMVRNDPLAQNQGKLLELRTMVLDYLKQQEAGIRLVEQGKMDEARQLAVGVQDDRYEGIRTIVGELQAKENARLHDQVNRHALAAERNIQLFMALGACAFLLGLMMILLLNHTIVRPLGSLSGLARQVAQGDLTVQIAGEGRRDEMGMLSQSFGEMVGALRRSTTDIGEAVNQLGTSAGEILAATTQVASSTAETAAAITQTTTTVEEVRQAAQLSNQKAQDVSASAKGVEQVSRGGKKAMDEVAVGMQGIHREMESIAKTVVLLSELGQSIGGIIATVTDLADQSNLLAVNAAIEAAKAGEQGKGFGVVAQEIKSLAEQSKQATSQIRSILGDVQRATSAAVMATEQGGKAVEAGMKQTQQAVQAIVALTESTAEAAQAATQIAVSSQQQVVGMDQVGMAMENINQAGLETASSMKQVEGAAQNLNELGRNLKRLVQRFSV